MSETYKNRFRYELQVMVSLILILIGLALITPSTLQAEPFVFISLPDTQVYSENRYPGDGRIPAVTDERGTAAIFFDQTQWIVDNAELLGIQYVGHLGDVVEHGDNLDEWARAKAAMDLLLQADIPHGTVMGNHDDNHGGNYRQNYLDNFGPQVFEGKAWYSASSPGGGASLQLLEHEGMKIGFLNFSIDQPQAEVDWANQIIAYYPDVIFVIGTHRYLYDFKVAGGRYGETVDSLFGPLDVRDEFEEGVADPNTGEELFNELVTQHPNIVMIHSGHFHSEWLRLDGQNSAAQTVIQILTDYQSTRNGGDGWLRIYEMDFDNNTFTFNTYSPTLNRYRTTIDHFVETIHVAYAEREMIRTWLGFTENEYFAILGLLRDTATPDGFLLSHPDFDEPAEQEYYNQYLSDLFYGDAPPGFDNILEWEGLWLQGFAADPSNPFDFRDWVRSPSGTMDVDYSAYYSPAARVCTTLGERRHWFFLDMDIFSFSGQEGDVVKVRLGTNPFDLTAEQRATLIVKEMTLAPRFFETDHGPLLKQITMTLPRTGNYMISVVQHPRFFEGESFSGGYCLSLEAPPTTLEMPRMGWNGD